MHVVSEPMDNTSVSSTPLTPAINNELAEILMNVIISILGGFVSVFGIVTNIINMVIFVKQGLNDTVNISLFSLAVSDVLCLADGILLAVLFSPLYVHSASYVTSNEFRYLTGGVFHVILTRITGWITAYIAFERWLSVAMPVRVKVILTNRRVMVCVVCIYVVVIAWSSPVFYTSQVVWRTDTASNRTYLGVHFTPNRRIIDSLTFNLVAVVSVFGSLLTVIATTTAMVIRLTKNTKWRKSNSTSGNNQFSRKELKMIKMVKILSLVYVVCSAPEVAWIIWPMFDRTMIVTGMNQNLVNVVNGCTFLLEAINSSIGLLVYYFMSSKYKQTFREVFCTC